jgi:hypothetical protein
MKGSCEKSAPNSGNATNQITLAEVLYSLITPAGVTINNIIHLTDGTEHWYFAKGLGMVKWVSPWGSSYVSEIHAPGARPNNVPEPICSFTL